MYCVIQEVKLKKPDIKGNSISIEPSSFTVMGETYYSYERSKERFERNIKKAYKISIHHSYRENGKVKKKQWNICTIGHYTLIEYGSCIDDYCRLENKLEAIGISRERFDNLVYSKLNPLVEKIEKEYEETEEYKTVEAYEEVLQKHREAKREFDNKYGGGYDLCYDVFGELRNESKLNQIIKDYEYRKEYEEKSRQSWEQQYRSYYENSNSNYGSNNRSGYSKNSSGNYNDDEKKLLKKIYKKMAKEFHPDKNLDRQEESQEIMVLVNKLKEQWGI